MRQADKMKTNPTYQKALLAMKESTGYHPSDKAPSMVADKDDVFHRYIARLKERGDDVYEELAGKKPAVTPAATSTPSSVDNILNKYLAEVAASARQNKKLYKKFLPTNHMVIRVASTNYTDAVEFARILCGALDEELLADAFTHTDGDQVEVECSIAGPIEECSKAVNQLTAAVSEAFQSATVKIGGIVVKTNCVTNKKSCYQQMDLKSASTQYRKFLLKFI